MRLSIHSTTSLSRLFTLIPIAAVSLAANLSPLQVDFGTQFLGYDGQWSAAQIRVGTAPEQWLQLLPSTISSETWVVGPGGCDNTPTCTSKRGGLFYWNQSQTWDPLGYFDLGYNTLSGTTPIGQYGLDNISISDTVSASHQSVAVINTTDIWLGEFGLGIAELIYNNNVQYQSLLSTLAQNESLIPSHSYGYTAGAFYKGKGLSGSLTLGGVDTTRFIPTDVNFSLSENYRPIVAITSISVNSNTTVATAVPTNWSSNPQALLSSADAFLATIDTSTPFMWMPGLVCDAFAAALNLSYDTSVDLYTFTNDSSPELLTAWNLTFTFTLANTPTSQVKVNVPISYDAFNLQLSYPFPGLDDNYTSAPLNYFPLRRATQTSQYTIGRAFLQEAYLTVDYERIVFSVAPAEFPDTNLVSPNLVAIPKPGSETGNTGTGISLGAKIGIAIGVVFAVLLLALGAFMIIRKRARRSSTKQKEVKSKQSLLDKLKRRKANTKDVPELSGDKRHPKEMQADTSNSRFELDGDTMVEMPAGEVPSTYLQINNETHPDARALNDPRQPIELANQHSLTKEAEATTFIERERSESPVPPYYLSAIPQVDGQNDSISPRSRHDSNPFNATHSSGEQGISPISTSGFPQTGQGSLDSQNRGVTSSINPLLRDGTGQSLLSPDDVQQNRQIPRLAPQDILLVRTLSRDSCFREESSEEPGIISEGIEEQTHRRRFSWEEGTTM